jgi:hypothetical protein
LGRVLRPEQYFRKQVNMNLHQIMLSQTQLRSLIMSKVDDLKTLLDQNQAALADANTALAANAAATTNLGTLVAEVLARLKALSESGGATPAELDALLTEASANLAAAQDLAVGIKTDADAEVKLGTDLQDGLTPPPAPAPAPAPGTELPPLAA